MAISILYPLYIYRSERCDEQKSSLILIQLHRSFEVRLRSRRESAQLASCGLVSKIAPKPWNPGTCREFYHCFMDFLQDPKLITCVIYAKSPVFPIVSMTID